MPFLHILEPRYPAAFTVHWTTGPTPCCVKHARALINLGRMLGTHVPATAAPEGAECENCINEAKTRGETPAGVQACGVDGWCMKPDCPKCHPKASPASGVIASDGGQQ